MNDIAVIIGATILGILLIVGIGYVVFSPIKQNLNETDINVSSAIISTTTESTVSSTISTTSTTLPIINTTSTINITSTTIPLIQSIPISVLLCTSPKGKNMTYEDAVELSKRCAGTVNTSVYSCNDNTGTFWFDLNPKYPKKGCTSWCVINIDSNSVNIILRCTELDNITNST